MVSKPLAVNWPQLQMPEIIFVLAFNINAFINVKPVARFRSVVCINSAVMASCNLYLVAVLHLMGKAIALLPKEIVIQQEVHVLRNLIVELNKIYDFDNIVLYNSFSNNIVMPTTNFLLLRNRNQSNYLTEDIMLLRPGNILAKCIWSSEMEKPLMSFTISPWKNDNSFRAIPNLGNILSNKNLAVVILNDIVDLDFREVLALSLRACTHTKIIFFLTNHQISNATSHVHFKQLERFFRWCWSKNILNLILMFLRKQNESNTDDKELKVYTYTPFPTPIQIINLSNKEPQDYFPNRIKNLLGYALKTHVIADKPMTFKVSNFSILFLFTFQNFSM